MPLMKHTVYRNGDTISAQNTEIFEKLSIALAAHPLLHLLQPQLQK